MVKQPPSQEILDAVCRGEESARKRVVEYLFSFEQYAKNLFFKQNDPHDWKTILTDATMRVLDDIMRGRLNDGECLRPKIFYYLKMIYGRDMIRRKSKEAQRFRQFCSGGDDADLNSSEES
jgi:hypothetical protein